MILLRFFEGLFGLDLLLCRILSWGRFVVEVDGVMVKFITVRNEYNVCNL